MDRPYFIERDLVNPPLDLQRQIFPWIEKVFDDPRIKDLAPTWIVTCNEEMEGGNTDAVKEQTDPWFKRKEKDEIAFRNRAGTAYEHGFVVDLLAFLKLM
ncbi:hypothetical protein BGZ72_001110, partial [Mortierella alpina]